MRILRSKVSGVSAVILLCAASLFAADNFAERAPRYRLRTSDVVAVGFRLTPEFNFSATIQPDGYVGIPQIGDVDIAGLTLPEATEKIRAKASERLNSPEVSLQLTDYEKPYLLIGGEVAQPGRVAYRGPITALRAIESAGGFKESARSNQVLVIRPVGAGEAETKVLDLTTALRGKSFKEDMELRSGDMVIVPERRLTKIERYIKMSNVGLYFNPLAF